jgi:predicted glycogen debranching enzyme
VCADVTGPSGGAAREWLVADGAGGFASGTVSGLRTRRYHALLVVPGDGGGRNVGLVSLDPVLLLPGGTQVKLATHEWASGAVSPAGHRHLELFELVDGLPRWRWRIGDLVLERELAMAHGQPSLGVVHRLVSAPGPVRLSLTALCTWRDSHSGRRAGLGGPPATTKVAGGVVVEDAYRLAGPGWRARGEWWYDAYAREEAARGNDAVEDLWCVGSFTATLEPGGVMEVSAWAGDLRRQPAPATDLVAAARRRARAVLVAAKPADAVDASLALAADAFIVKGPDVVAGYPWLGCWMRDALTAYEGLFLRTGRAAEGAALLRRYTAEAVERAGGTSDAPLWLVHAVDRHVAATGDVHLGADLAGPLDQVLAGYTADEAPFAARLDQADGLLALAPERAAATWMNARIGGQPVTPRDGKPVDLNALWVNALAGLARLTEGAGRDACALWAGHDAAQRSFAKRYLAPAGWLYDLVDAQPAAYPLGAGPHLDDPVLRPNQLFAFGLPYAPLDGADPGAVRAVGRALLTPLGLRTLAPTEYGYQGIHAGAEAARYEAYHQGTVWPWLIGAHVDACRAVGLPVAGLLAGLAAHLPEHGVGSVSELADGDPPHRAGGCPFSARSVAEVIRARAVLKAHT